MATAAMRAIARRKQAQVQQAGGAVEYMAKTMQMLDAHIDASNGFSSPTIIVPQQDGTTVPAAKYTLERREREAAGHIMDAQSAFIFNLDHGPKQVVTNYSDLRYWNVLNGESYTIGPRETKALPECMARHFYEKTGFAQKNVDYEKRLAGTANPFEDVTELEHNEFKANVQSFDGIAHETGHRKKVY